MNINLIAVSSIAFIFILSLVTTDVIAQAAPVKNNLFDSDNVMTIKLKGNVRDLLNDRTDIPADFSFELSFFNENRSEVILPVQMKTRGHFRKLKENCNYPPLLIQFPKVGVQVNTLFSEQHKLKLVMPCKGDEYIIREWLAYKLYNLITPLSFKARLVKVIMEESKNGKTQGPFYALFLEEEKQMGKRNNMQPIDVKLQPKQVQLYPFITMAIFQYLIGNTDWSIQYQQNIKLLVADSAAVPIAIPYDFDHSGIVNAPYAHPASALQLSSVRQRRYRGYCMPDVGVMEAVIAKYRVMKEEIYQLFNTNALLDSRTKKSIIHFLDDFFLTINNEKAWRKDFAYPCDKNGTGNVVIKGLKED